MVVAVAVHKVVAAQVVEVAPKEAEAVVEDHRDPKNDFLSIYITAGTLQFRRFFLPAIHHFVVVFHQSITQTLTHLQ